MSADDRAELARRFLAEARQRSVEQMPPTLLMREVAELRRLLGQVLAVLAERQAAAGHVNLNPAQVLIVLTALDDAARYREDDGLGSCTACHVSAGGLCGQHAEDLDQADLYRQLVREIGGGQ